MLVYESWFTVKSDGAPDEMCRRAGSVHVPRLIGMKGAAVVGHWCRWVWWLDRAGRLMGLVVTSTYCSATAWGV
jgi:hypothetical protein